MPRRAGVPGVDAAGTGGMSSRRRSAGAVPEDTAAAAARSGLSPKGGPGGPGVKLAPL
jgi:hypothetical protein